MFATLEQFGNIDIYLFDQLQRGRIAPGMRIFDAGCGGGRNLLYLLKAGYEVFGADASLAAIADVRNSREVCAGITSGELPTRIIAALSFAHEFADVVICSAVLHFAPG